MFLFFSGYSLNERIRIGFYGSPGIAWSKPAGNDLTKGKPRFGVNYGFTLEYWFAKNYGLSTGLAGAFDGCNIGSRNLFENDASGNKIKTVTEKYGFHYVVLPAYLKLKTNDIKDSKFCVWGQLGVDLQFTVNARATFSDSIGTTSSHWVEKENILRSNNEVSKVISGFRSNFFDVRLGAGAGFEYRFDEQASLFAGVFYHNGFINNLFDRDAKKEPNVMRFMSLRIGILF
ncbi:MAG: PorT family protein [Chitinophagales bacterium]|nr:PorT family protein [Chitinophagales bacterium]